MYTHIAGMALCYVFQVFILHLSLLYNWSVNKVVSMFAKENVCRDSNDHQCFLTVHQSLCMCLNDQDPTPGEPCILLLGVSYRKHEGSDGDLCYPRTGLTPEGEGLIVLMVFSCFRF